MKPSLLHLLFAALACGCMPAAPPEDPERFLLLDAHGEPASSDEHVCVLDQASQLTWAVPRGGHALLDPAHHYAWFSEDRAQHLGEPGSREGGTCALDTCNTTALLAALNARGLCGHADWRLPTHEEAIMLGKRHGQAALGMHPRLFPGAHADEVWTGTSFRLYPQSAWAFDIGNGLDRADMKSVAKPVRPVRGTLVLPSRR